MSIESEVYNALKGLVANRVFPDVAPLGTARPFLTYQGVGGGVVNFLDPTIPSKKNKRMQINVWADSRTAAASLAEQVEDVMRTVTVLQPTVLGAAISTFEPDTKLYGCTQDFSLWL